MGSHDTSMDEPAHAPGPRKGEEITDQDRKESGREEKHGREKELAVEGSLPS